MMAFVSIPVSVTRAQPQLIWEFQAYMGKRYPDDQVHFDNHGQLWVVNDTKVRRAVGHDLREITKTSLKHMGLKNYKELTFTQIMKCIDVQPENPIFLFPPKEGSKKLGVRSALCTDNTNLPDTRVVTPEQLAYFLLFTMQEKNKASCTPYRKRKATPAIVPQPSPKRPHLLQAPVLPQCQPTPPGHPTH